MPSFEQGITLATDAHSARLATIGVLRSFSFVRAPDQPSKWVYDFGNFVLHAVEAWDFRHGGETVMLSGVLSNERSIREVEYFVPPVVESKELLAALVAYALDGGSTVEFVPARPTAWLELGRRNRHLLPWMRAAVTRKSAPSCAVQRSWARALMRDLTQALASAPGDSLTSFAFDGEVLMVRCGAFVRAVAAAGSAWPEPCSVRCADLTPLPSRFIRDPVSFLAGDRWLVIGRRSFRRATPAITTTEALRP